MPEVGDKLRMEGFEEIVNVSAFDARPPTVTTTFPVVAVDGTVTVMALELQLVTVANTPLKVTVLEP